VALGLQIQWRWLLDWTALLAAGSAGLLLGVRDILHRRWLKSGGDRHAYLLLCPNLTIVALATKAMIDLGTDAKLTAWLVLTGLFMTIPSLLLLPSGLQSPTATTPVVTADAKTELDDIGIPTERPKLNSAPDSVTLQTNDPTSHRRPSCEHR
jgi:hypothetical protein